MRVALAGFVAISMVAGAAASGGTPLSASGRIGDLDAAASAYGQQSRAFTPATRTAALRFIAQTKPRADLMTSEQFLLAVFRIAAYADNGHDTENDRGEVWWPTGRLPVRMIRFEDGWAVSRARSGAGGRAR